MARQNQDNWFVTLQAKNWGVKENAYSKIEGKVAKTQWAENSRTEEDVQRKRSKLKRKEKQRYGHEPIQAQAKYQIHRKVKFSLTTVFNHY